MLIVIDTNVIISGIFFGGYPRKIIEAVVKSEIKAYASADILREYRETIEEMIAGHQMRIKMRTLDLIFLMIEMVEPQTHVEICRDKNDDMFIDCAKEANALFIVSGDKDLLVLGEYEGIKIITAREFCRKYSCF